MSIPGRVRRVKSSESGDRDHIQPRRRSGDTRAPDDAAVQTLHTVGDLGLDRDSVTGWRCRERSRPRNGSFRGWSDPDEARV